MKVQFIQNYFKEYNSKQFRKYNIIEVEWSVLLNCYLYYAEKELYLIPKEVVKIYKH